MNFFIRFATGIVERLVRHDIWHASKFIPNLFPFLRPCHHWINENLVVILKIKQLEKICLMMVKLVFKKLKVQFFSDRGNTDLIKINNL